MPSPCKVFHTGGNERVAQIVKELVKEGYTPLGTGKGRTALTRPNGRFVLKLPYTDSGEEANRYEHAVYKQGKAKERLAKCRLVKLYGLDCLLMEKVREMTEEEICEHTADSYDHWIYEIDCEQVGYNRRGKIVAWDYEWG